MIKDMVSVVLPVYYVNMNWLKRSIVSVLEQDYSNLELIVVNDGATQNIDELIRCFRIKKYIKNPKNMKLPYSLNRGFEIAEGRYHTWTSADNFMMPGMISSLVGEILSDPRVSIVFGSSLYVDEYDNPVISSGGNGAMGRYLSDLDLKKTDVDRKFTYFSTLGACFLYKKEVWEETGGYDELCHGAEDYDFWIRASRKFKIKRLPDGQAPFYGYRVHPESISRTVAYCYSEARVRILRREQALFPEDKDIRGAIDYYRKRFFLERNKKIRSRIKSGLRRTIERILNQRGINE
jgi:O-antigen biosynthesis protein